MADGLYIAVWLQSKVRECGLRLNTGPVCEAQCCWGALCGFRQYRSALVPFL